MRTHVFGQHIAHEQISRALHAHTKRATPKKALVFSFHGWTGGGKNYVAKFLAQSLYK